jgi:hypothetical protein
MFMDTKWLTLAAWAVKLIAPLAAKYLEQNPNALSGFFPNGEKNVLIKLLKAVNADDRTAKEAIKQTQEEVKKIQGV